MSKVRFFIPPKPNRFICWIMDRLRRPIIKKLHNIRNIVIKDEDQNKLRSLKNDRLIFFSNHPSTAEPPIAYHISSVIGDRFHYMASREVFNWNMGFNKFLMSRLGAFSIIQGSGDRDSMKMTRSVLAQPSGKLVLFPEGTPTSGENDSLMPFQAGVAQLGFWGLEDARKQDENADITILSSFIKYVVKSSPEESLSYIESRILVVENALGIKAGDRNLLRRFLHIGRFMLEKTEREYNIPPGHSTDFEYRMGRVRHAILDGVAERFNFPAFNPKEDAIQKLRYVLGVVEMINIKFPMKGLPKMNEEEFLWAKAECGKAYDFIVMKADYIITHPSAERLLEWLMRFESYILGKTARFMGGGPWPLPIDAHVFCAEPFPISSYYPKTKIKKDKMDAIKALIERMRSDMDSMRETCMHLTPTIVKAGVVD